MRSPEDVQQVLALAGEGLNHCQIARFTGIPRGTIRDWLNGHPPRAHARFTEGCGKCGGLHDLASLPPAAYSYLLGLYLGDGYIASFPRTTCLRISLDSRHPRIIGACVAAMRQVMPGRVASARRLAPHNLVVASCYSKAWPCVLPQHGCGPKHERRIVLADWQLAITQRNPRDLVRGLIHSDGSRFINTVRHGDRVYRYPRYQFTSASDDIRAIFCGHLDLIGIRWRRMTPRDISIARRASVAALDEFVGPKR